MGECDQCGQAMPLDDLEQVSASGMDWYLCPSCADQMVISLSDEERRRQDNYAEARRRMQALSDSERDAWIRDQRETLDRIVDDVCQHHGGYLDAGKDAWTQLVLDTLAEPGSSGGTE